MASAPSERSPDDDKDMKTILWEEFTRPPDAGMKGGMLAVAVGLTVLGVSLLMNKPAAHSPGKPGAQSTAQQKPAPTLRP